ncbi:MAG: hypothetical protein ACI9JN_000091 [Bacteroidia bacterium]|jgi:hypothetical protein
MKCSSNKKPYHNESTAERALIEARIRFVGNTAINVYQCSECDDWHLTSQGQMNNTLQEMIQSGDLDKEIKQYEWREKYGN